MRIADDEVEATRWIEGKLQRTELGSCIVIPSLFRSPMFAAIGSRGPPRLDSNV